MRRFPHTIVVFFFNDTATTEIYTLSLHDALPISAATRSRASAWPRPPQPTMRMRATLTVRSEEHTSELQSRQYLVCRLLLEKKKKPASPPALPLYLYPFLIPSPISAYHIECSRLI